MHDHTHDPRTPAGRAALRALLATHESARLAAERERPKLRDGEKLPRPIYEALRDSHAAVVGQLVPIGWPSFAHVAALLDLADERDTLAALLDEARPAVARGPAAIVMLLAKIDAALKEPRP